MVTDSGPWTNKYIENIAIDDLKMTFSRQKNVISIFFKFDYIS